MLVDANVLIYGVDVESKFHGKAKSWLTACLDGTRSVGIAWQSIAAFVRLTTSPRIYPNPLSAGEAWAYVSDWLDADVVWIPGPGKRYRSILEDLIERYEPPGNAFPDLMLAALAIEHGLTIYSADTDFARFTEVEWHNPVAPG